MQFKLVVELIGCGFFFYFAHFCSTKTHMSSEFCSAWAVTKQYIRAFILPTIDA